MSHKRCVKCQRKEDHEVHSNQQRYGYHLFREPQFATRAEAIAYTRLTLAKASDEIYEITERRDLVDVCSEILDILDTLEKT